MLEAFAKAEVMKDFVDIVQIRLLPRRMDGNRRLNDAYGEHTRSYSVCTAAVYRGYIVI